MCVTWATRFVGLRSGVGESKVSWYFAVTWLQKEISKLKLRRMNLHRLEKYEQDMNMFEGQKQLANHPALNPSQNSAGSDRPEIRSIRSSAGDL